MKLLLCTIRSWFCAFLFVINFFNTTLLGNGFVAGTLVKVPDGYAAIETIVPGDTICCCKKNGAVVERPVTAIARCRPAQTCVVIQCTNGIELHASPQQKFFVRDARPQHRDAWMKAGTLSPEKLLLSTSKQECFAIKNVWRIDLPAGDEDHPTEFYDLTIDEEHNYLVTNSDLIAYNF